LLAHLGEQIFDREVASRTKEEVGHQASLPRRAQAALGHVGLQRLVQRGDVVFAEPHCPHLDFSPSVDVCFAFLGA
jgi:hypothetical protein